MGIFFFLKTRSLQVLDESDNGRRDDLIVITSEAAGLIQTQLFVVVHTHVCLEQRSQTCPTAVGQDHPKARPLATEITTHRSYKNRTRLKTIIVSSHPPLLTTK